MKNKNIFLSLIVVCLVGCGKSGLLSKNSQSESASDSGAQSPVVQSSCADSPTSSLERDACLLTNSERRKQGLEPLRWDSRLFQAAQDHANDMSTRGYFSHVSPEGKSMVDRINKYSVRYWSAGENIASGFRTGESVVAGWMNSPGHRANILGQFNAIGIAQKDGYWVQVFIHD